MPDGRPPRIPMRDSCNASEPAGRQVMTKARTASRGAGPDCGKFGILTLFAAQAGTAALLSCYHWLGVRAATTIVVFATAAVVTFMCGYPRRIGIVVLSALALIVFGGGSDATLHGPYARWYNSRLLKMATNARLVGRSESEIERVLGKSTYVSRTWSKWRMATGMPAKGAKFITTFGYAPFPLLPSGVFQVHCCAGTVASLEVLDD
jgi:hypothetical protein